MLDKYERFCLRRFLSEATERELAAKRREAQDALDRAFEFEERRDALWLVREIKEEIEARIPIAVRMKALGPRGGGNR